MDIRKPTLPVTAKPVARSRRKLDTLVREDTFQTLVFELVCTELRERNVVVEVEQEARGHVTRRVVSEAILLLLGEEVDARHRLVLSERTLRWTMWTAAAGSCRVFAGYLDEMEDTLVDERRARSRLITTFASSMKCASQKVIERFATGLRSRQGLWARLDERRKYTPFVPHEFPPLYSVELEESSAREALIAVQEGSWTLSGTECEIDRNYWCEVQNRRYIRRCCQLAFESLRAEEFIAFMWTRELCQRQSMLMDVVPHLNDPDHIARVLAIQCWVRRSKACPLVTARAPRMAPSTSHEHYAGLRRTEGVLTDRADQRHMSDAEYTIYDEGSRLLAAHELASLHVWRSYVRMLDRAADYYFAGVRWKIPSTKQAAPTSSELVVVSDSPAVGDGSSLDMLLADEALQRRFFVEGEEAWARGLIVVALPDRAAPVRSKSAYIQQRLLDEERVRNAPPHTAPRSTLHDGIALGIAQYQRLIQEAGPLVQLSSLLTREDRMRSAVVDIESVIRSYIEENYFRSIVGPRNRSNLKWIERMEHVRRHRFDVGATVELRNVYLQGKFLNYRSHIEIAELVRRRAHERSLLYQQLTLLDCIRDEITLVQSFLPNGGQRHTLRDVTGLGEDTPSPDRVAYVNCVFVPKRLVCVPGSDLLKSAHVVLRCRLIAFPVDPVAEPTLISTSCFPMEYVREFSSARRMSLSGVFTSDGNADSDDVLAILRPQYVASAKSDFCEAVKSEERDMLSTSLQGAYARDEAVAKALKKRLNSMEYVFHLQSIHKSNGNLFQPEMVVPSSPKGRLMLEYTLELTNTLAGEGGSTKVLACSVELPRQSTVGANPTGGGDSWWCKQGNPNPTLTDATCVDGTSNQRLQQQSIFGSLSFDMHLPSDEQPQSRSDAFLAGSLSAIFSKSDGQLCINVAKAQSTRSHTASSTAGSTADEEAEMDQGMDGDGWVEDDDVPTPYFLSIGRVTVDRGVLEQTLGTSEAYHRYRRSASLEESMSWRRGTNANIRIVISPHYPGLPQALYIPVEPLEMPSGCANTDRVVLIPEYVRRAEERYLQQGGSTKLVLDDIDRQAESYLKYIAAEHEKQQWKIPIQKSFGELKISATLQLQGSGGADEPQTVQAPLMSQGVRYLDSHACFTAMKVYINRVASRAQSAREDGTVVSGPPLKPPSIRISLLSLKHSFADAGSGSVGVSSKNRAEITLVGNIVESARAIFQ